MHTFMQQYTEDLRVITGLQGKIEPEALLRLRVQIDRMRSQNMRQAALAMWYAKVQVPKP